MNKIHILRFVLCMIFGGLAHQAIAQVDQGISVEAELSRTRVYVGDEITYQVIIRGVANPPAPTVDFPDSVRTEFNGRSSQSFTTMRNINGRNRSVTDRRFSYQYTLTVTEPGTIEIPSPSIDIAGQSYSGQQLSFESLFPTFSEDDDLEVSLDQNTLYLNQTVEVECSWWFDQNTTQFSFTSSNIPESFEIRGLQPPSGRSQQVGFQINGQQMIGSVIQDRHLGRNMSKFSFRFTITPTDIGTFELGPIRVVFTRQQATGRNIRAYVESEPKTMQVQAVPTENRPEQYAGAIGAYRLQARSSHSSVNVGDPIQITLQITGDEPMIGAEDAPDLSASEEFNRQFKIASEGWREVETQSQGVRVFETTIRALDHTTKQIPAIKLPSFNPDTEKFETYTSDPIPLMVHEVEVITLSDAVVTGSPSPTPQIETVVERVKLSKRTPGIWVHRPAEEAIQDSHFRLNLALQSPVWITVIASGPGLFALSLAVCFFRKDNEQHPGITSRQWSRCKTLDRKGQPTEALRLYIASTLKMNPEAIVADDVFKLPISEDTAQSASELLLSDERVRFDAPTAVLGHQANQEHDRILFDIHTQIRHSKGAVS